MFYGIAAKYQRFRIKTGMIPIIPLLIVVATVVAAIFAGFIAPHSWKAGDLSQYFRPPFFVQGGSRNYLLGTDQFGRDIISRIIYGSRVTLEVSVVTILLSASVGTALGIISGFLGRVADAIIMRLTDIALSVPFLLLAVALAAVRKPSLGNVVFVIGVLLWARFSRVIRSEVLTLRTRDFVAQAELAGSSGFRIMYHHIFPNIVPTLLVLSSLHVAIVILMEGSLSFLGVGVPPPTPSWGLMVAEGRSLIASAWWVSLFPGLAMAMLVLSVNWLGDWIRDRLDPKLRQL